MINSFFEAVTKKLITSWRLSVSNKKDNFTVQQTQQIIANNWRLIKQQDKKINKVAVLATKLIRNLFIRLTSGLKR